MVFAATIFLGALLVFSVQPLLGKALLPWFGGGPAVWSACLLFFQIGLLLGYLWAHGLDRWLAPRKQALVQLCALGASLILLTVLWFAWPTPILPSAAWKPEGSGMPVLHILAILTVGVGLPYLLLSATSPLVQAWYRNAHPGQSPWRLYALSNLGSLLGLLGYPFLVEPSLGLVSQGHGWSGLYVLFVAGMAACAWPLLTGRSENAKDPSPAGEAEPVTPPTWGRRSLWFGLAAAGSALLMAGTNQMCQEVAVIPFLWVLPLALYLLTFILAFRAERAVARAWVALLSAAAAAGAVVALHLEYELGVIWQVLVYAGLIFSACLLCHAELDRAKPHPRHLTGFYLILSAGGATGGAFVALLAPAIFKGYFEFHLALFACGCLHLLALWLDPGSWIHGRLRWLKRSVPIALLLALGAALGQHPLRFYDEVIDSSRNFYGVLRVKLTHPEVPKYWAHDLMDGQILHGYQLQAPALKRVATAYFSATSGLGLSLAHHPARREGRPLKIGLIGLGIGTIAAHGRPGDSMRFYEINPEVIRLASGEGGSFSFLSDSLAAIEIVEGDARLSLEAELASGERHDFDVFVLDAFQSDAIPVHLLTREALALYLEHLAEDGLLVLHVTNLNLSLEPIVDRLATELNLVVATVRDEGDGWISLRSHWMLLTRDPMILAEPAIAAKASLPAQLPGMAPLWTDDHTSLLPILR